MSAGLRTTVGHAFRRMALPLVCYYAVTLVVPLVNGAAQSSAFVEHALVVLVVPLLFIVLACAVHEMARALAGPDDVRKEQPYVLTPPNVWLPLGGDGPGITS